MATKTKAGEKIEASAPQQGLADRAHQLLLRRASVVAYGSKISAPLAMLASGLGVDAAQVEQALAANPQLFTREERGGQVYFGIEKPGLRSARVTDWKPEHDLANRLNPDAIAISPEESRLMTAEFARRAAANKAARLAAEQEQLRLEQEAMRAMQSAAAAQVGGESDLFTPYTLPEVALTELYEPIVEQPAPEEQVAATLARPNTIFTISVNGSDQQVDLSAPLDEIIAQYRPAFAELLRAALTEDFRFVNFAEQWYLDDLVERFSKGDLRRIKDYLAETNEALSDRTFLTDLFNKRPSDPDYETYRFSLNYRLLKEKKEFEFVGVADERLWLPTNSTIIHQKRKASEIGQDYRYLDEPALAESGDNVSGSGDKRKLEHTLTYYEYENGLLPLDRAAQEFFPPPVLDDQRAAVFRFESPQLYVTYLAELRFPSPNRGGYLVGLDEFYQNLVPGAVFSIEATARPNVYTITYNRLATQQEERLLQFDERRNRYVFRPVLFNVQSDPGMLLSEARFPRLEGLHRLEESERKRPELVTSRAFEVVGNPVERDSSTAYWALLDDLFPAVNIQRPFSRAYLRAILTSSQYPYFSADPEGGDSYYYDPTKK